MAGAIKHRHQTALPSSGADVDAPQWNDSLVASGGTNGQVFTSDNTQPDGWSWQTNLAPAWVLAATQALTGASSYNIIGLGVYSEIVVIAKAVVLSSSGEIQLRISTDSINYLNSSGDYLGVTGAGVESNFTSVEFYSGAATAARSGYIHITGFNVASVPKLFNATFFSSDSIGMRLSNTTLALQAIQVFATAGNLNSGTVYVLGRP